MAGKRKRTREQVQAEMAKLRAEDEMLEALETLPQHASVKNINESVLQAVKDTKADEARVRIAELAMSSINLVAFYRDSKGPVEDYMSMNATYRNTGNPEQFWYSPDGKGNPPKWLVDLIGPKPKSKKQADMDEWMKKAEKYKVQPEETKKAA